MHKYTEDELVDICWYYGQYKDNLPKSMINMLIKKYEEEIK